MAAIPAAPAERCLWWDTAPPVNAAAIGELPARADVAIVGGGYTGLAAARALARAGVRTVLLERETLGWGASGRNGGFVLPGYKPDLATILRRHGEAAARELFQCSLDAVKFVERVISDESIDAEFTRAGHLTLAARPGHLPALAAEARLLAERFRYQTELLSPAQLKAELGSSRYHGGLLDPGAAALHPAKYVRGLAAAAARAGAGLHEQTEVRSVRRAGSGFELLTACGTLHADAVLVATNGYTGPAIPALERRVVPLGSYLIATAPLEESLARRLIPRGRVLSDTKNLLFYFRLSADRRLLFGGRAAFGFTTIAECARILRRGMVSVFPELAGIAVEYAWGGRLGITRDLLPHAGVDAGIHYSLGYAGHGVALASYLGDWMGQTLAGRRELPPLARLAFPSIPLYRGRPWFLPLVGGYYRVKDWVG